MMKYFKLMILTTVLLFGAMGTASAYTLNSIPGFSDPNITVCVENGIATIYGHTDSGIKKSQAGNYVASLEGVNRVINLVTFN